jgi:hypothetical protein
VLLGCPKTDDRGAHCHENADKTTTPTAIPILTRRLSRLERGDIALILLSLPQLWRAHHRARGPRFIKAVRDSPVSAHRLTTPLGSG